MVNFQMRSALQFHEFSSKMVNFQKRSEGCRAVSCRSVGSVADSLFRPHPEQRARASREPKEIANIAMLSKLANLLQNHTNGPP